MTFSSINSTYGDCFLVHIKNIVTIRPINKCIPTINIEALRKPILSYKIPLIEGPIKAPSAKVLVHRPEIRPKVSKLFGKPCALKWTQ